MKKMDKKGVIDQLGGLIVPLVAITIILVVGFLIMSQSKEVVEDSFLTTTSVVNESAVASNSTRTALGTGEVVSLTCTQVYNGTASALVAPVNYSCDRNGILIVGESIWGATVNVTYNYKRADIAWNATGVVQSSMEDIPGWLPIIIITVIGALLILLVKKFREE